MMRGGRSVLKPRVLRTTGGTAIPPPVITNPGNQHNLVGDAVSLSIASTNATLWSATNVPTGIKINSATGKLSGTVSAVQVLHTTLIATGPGGTTSVKFEWVVESAGPAPTVNKPADQTTPQGTADTLQIEATGATIYEATGLPAGLNINSGTGKISGTANVQEATTVHITVKGPGGTAETTFLWTVEAPTPVETYTPNTVNPVANEIYKLIQPLTYADKELGYPLLRYTDAIGLMWNDLNEIVRDKVQPNGTIIPGYAVVMKLDTCPENWLPWLAQFNGVQAPENMPELDRELILAAGGLKRGTPASIKAFIAQFLIGSKRVDLFERSEGKAYKLTIVTYTSETSPEAEKSILAAIEGEDLVPAGINVDYKVVSGWIYEGIQGTAKTYQQLKESYTTYEKLARKE